MIGSSAASRPCWRTPAPVAARLLARDPPLLEQRDLHPALREKPGGRGADDPRTDDHDVDGVRERVGERDRGGFRDHRHGHLLRPAGWTRKRPAGGQAVFCRIMGRGTSRSTVAASGAGNEESPAPAVLPGYGPRDPIGLFSQRRRSMAPGEGTGRPAGVRGADVPNDQPQEDSDEDKHGITTVLPSGRRSGGPVHGGGRSRGNGRTRRRDHGGVLPGMAVAETWRSRPTGASTRRWGPRSTGVRSATATR